MYEFSVACKYLLPRWRQLSVSVISLISVLVIALVVWLIVVFFSVTNGLEKYWVGKFVALAGPVKVTPTDAYYQSYYYLVDTISEASDYRQKSITEKRLATASDPYDPEVDQEIPSRWPAPDVNEKGELKDLVSELAAAASEIPGVTVTDYETTFGNIRLRLAKGANHRARNFRGDDGDQAFIAQATLIGSLEPENSNLQNALMPLSGDDVTNILTMAGTNAGHIRSDTADTLQQFDVSVLRQRLQSIFKYLTVTQLKAAPEGWTIPRHLLPATGTLKAIAITVQGRLVQIAVPQDARTLPQLLQAATQAGYQAKPAQITLKSREVLASIEGQPETAVPLFVPVVLSSGEAFSAKLLETSPTRVSSIADLQFEVKVPLQDLTLEGITPFSGLSVAGFDLKQTFDAEPVPHPHWLFSYTSETSPMYRLPSDPAVGEGVLLPKAFQEAGLLAGDRGYVSYYTPTPSSVQEQRQPVYVAGFYDPGMIPMGGKLIFVDRQLTSRIRGAYGQQERDNGNGMRIRFADYSKADAVKAQLEQALKERGIDRYWNVETFRNYDFAKEILQQQQSDKNLFLVIAAVIMIVACSNIISMLIILVNDKKVEIGILRSMGASSQSIALIFGTCGCIMGVLGSIIGIGTAVTTLTHLDGLISLLGHLQGHEMFNPTFYGSSMPNELSFEALTFVLVVTATFSLLAGVVPAIKASLLKPSTILRSE